MNGLDSESKVLSSIWAPASQDSSHVGNAGVGGVLPFALPTFATSQFKRFFDCGRVVMCMLPSVLMLMPSSLL